MFKPLTQKFWKKGAFIFLLVPIICGLASAFLTYYQTHPSYDLAENPYVLYENRINARIGAYAPYAFLDKGGTLSGYIIDLTNAISRVMSARIMLLSRKLENPQEYANMQDADVILCMVKTPATSKLYDFSPAYAAHTFSIFARKDSPALIYNKKNKDLTTFAINTDGVYYDLNRDLIDSIACRKVASAEEALRAVSRKESDYAILETYIGHKIITEQSLENIYLLLETDENVEYSFAVPKGKDEVLKIFNEGLAYLQSTGQLTKIQKSWLDKRYIISKSGRDSIIISILVGIAVSCIIMLIFALLLKALKAQVAEHTVALEEEINERKRAEERLVSSQAQLIQADKMAAIGTLASGLSHEINNPNGLILLNLAFIQEVIQDLMPLMEKEYAQNRDFEIAGLPYTKLSSQIDLIITDSIQASKHIKGIVEDLKDFVRSDNINWQDDFDLNFVVQISLRLLENIIKKNTDHFQVQYTENLPLIMGSAQKIEQVILNLIINACQSLSDRSKAIKVSTSFDQNNIIFTVQDEGQGIAEKDLTYLFDPFFTTKREHGGTGLGLSISSSIVQAHQGNLTVQSIVNQGTVVTMNLPIH